MRYYYGYSEKPPVPEQNKNMDLILYEMVAEAQWKSEQESAESEGAVSESENEAQTYEQMQETAQKWAELPASQQLFSSQLPVDRMLDTTRNHAARKALQMTLESESGVDSKHLIDKKV